METLAPRSGGLPQFDPATVVPPETGRGAACIVPGVLWLRMPLDVIPHVNVWALDDRDGWTVVDTGMYATDSINAWDAAFAAGLAGKPVNRIIATHFHPDHAGMAGWLQQRTGADLWMTQGEYLTLAMAQYEAAGPVPAPWLAFHRAAGWTDEELAHYRADFGRYAQITSPLPATFRRLADRDRLAIGGMSWEVVIGAGHSPEHACLYCEDLGLFIAGDQVLPNISANVSVVPREPLGNPLDIWLTTLALIKQRVPDGVAVLPAHGRPFWGLHQRIDAIIAEHLCRLDLIRQSLGQGAKRVRELFPILFKRPVALATLRMATGEAMAHLNYLRHRGEVQCERGRDGVLVWTLHR